MVHPTLGAVLGDVSRAGGVSHVDVFGSGSSGASIAQDGVVGAAFVRCAAGAFGGPSKGGGIDVAPLWKV